MERETADAEAPCKQLMEDALSTAEACLDEVMAVAAKDNAETAAKPSDSACDAGRGDDHAEAKAQHGAADAVGDVSVQVGGQADKDLDEVIRDFWTSAPKHAGPAEEQEPAGNDPGAGADLLDAAAPAPLLAHDKSEVTGPFGIPGVWGPWHGKLLIPSSVSGAMAGFLGGLFGAVRLPSCSTCLSGSRNDIAPQRKCAFLAPQQSSLV